MFEVLTLKAEYEKLAGKARSTYLNDAKKFARWTIPSLLSFNEKLPSNSKSDTPDIHTPKYDSIGAEAVNFLANKIVLTFFPPQRPFFRLRADNSSDVAQEAMQDKEMAERVSSILSSLEREALLKFNGIAARADLVTAALHLIVTGNGLLYYNGKETRFYDLNRYIVERDISGGVVKLIIEDGLIYGTLSDEYKKLLIKHDFEYDDIVPLYTKVEWVASKQKYKVQQSLEDIIVPGQENVYYEKDELPYIPLAWQLTAGEHYGRGMVEMYKGAFAAVNALSREMTLLGVIASKIIFLVNPSSTTLANKIDELGTCESGTFFIGMPEDLNVVNVNKLNDATIVTTMLQEHTQLIRRVFLMDSAVQRDAERVTAEEIRRVAQQLETSFGGVYSRLSIAWQKPMAVIALKEVEKLVAKEKWLNIDIVTGLESISRSAEVEDLLSWLQSLQIFNGLSPEVMMRINMDDAIRRLAQGYNIDIGSYEGLLKSAAQVQQEMQQMQQQQMAAGLAEQGQG